MLKSPLTGIGSKGLATAAVVALLPTAAFARHHGDVRIDVPVVDIVPVCPPRVWVEPVYRTCVRRQWVEPVYQTITDRVWVDDATATVCDRVFVPDQYGVRDVVDYDRRGRQVVRRERVLLSPAHDEDRPRTVFVPGHYEDRPRQVSVADGHYQDVAVPEVVAPGHWEVADRPDTGLRIGIRLPF